MANYTTSKPDMERVAGVLSEVLRRPYALQALSIETREGVARATLAISNEEAQLLVDALQGWIFDGDEVVEIPDFQDLLTAGEE